MHTYTRIHSHKYKITDTCRHTYTRRHSKHTHNTHTTHTYTHTEARTHMHTPPAHAHTHTDSLTYSLTHIWHSFPPGLPPATHTHTHTHKHKHTHYKQTHKHSPIHARTNAQSLARAHTRTVCVYMCACVCVCASVRLRVLMCAHTCALSKNVWVQLFFFESIFRPRLYHHAATVTRPSLNSPAEGLYKDVSHDRRQVVWANPTFGPLSPLGRAHRAAKFANKVEFTL
jgi:hypothetical protein